MKLLLRLILTVAALAAAGCTPRAEETLTVDGFLVSDNVEAVSADVVDAGYRYSDHNPIYMDFILKAE